MSHRTQVIWLDSVECTSADLVGNKAATLSRLVRLGYPVPPGFCIPAQDLASLRTEFHTDGPTYVTTALATLDGPWAVRSSSTAEDSVGSAFAGIFKSVLGVRTFDEFKSAVNVVASSTESDTLRAYRNQQHLALAPVKMSILVQSMVDATSSGVCFGRHPISGADEVLIDSAFGLGSAIVSGCLNPDSFVVSPDGTAQLVRLGSKKRKTVLARSGTELVPTSVEERAASSISLGIAEQLAQIVRRLEHDIGGPQDMEWALRRDARIAVLQSRPITTIQCGLDKERG